MSDSAPLERQQRDEVILITGISGSGKSVALHALEDAGYFCVDNLPPELLRDFIRLEYDRFTRSVAVAVDVRTASSLPGLVPLIDQLRGESDQDERQEDGWVGQKRRNGGAPCSDCLASACAGAGEGRQGEVMQIGARGRLTGAGGTFMASISRTAEGPREQVPWAFCLGRSEIAGATSFLNLHAGA